MKKAFAIISSILNAALAALFCIWLFGQNRLETVCVIAAAVCTLLFAFLMTLFVKKLLEDWFSSEIDYVETEPLRRNRFDIRHPWLKIVVYMVLSRIAILVLAYLIDLWANGYSGGIFDTMRRLWLRSDSPSYLGISERWYVTDGDPMYHIVFLPFYPCVIAVFNLITHSSFASAMLVSSLSSVGAAIMLYELAAIDHDRRFSMRVVKYMFILPAAFFYVSPMTEGLFLLLCVSCMYFIRRRKYLIAALFGALASFTRSPGVVLIVPMVIEAVKDIVNAYRTKTRRKARLWLERVFACLIVPLGFAGYLLVNYAVWGDPLKFMQFQREHWSQQLGYFFNSASYQTHYFLLRLDESDLRSAWGLWFPNLFCIFASLIVMLPNAKRMRASYTGYFLAYFVMTIGPTWLLSAPRYLTAAFPIAFAMAYMTRGKKADAAATVVCAALLVLYLSANVLGFPVY